MAAHPEARGQATDGRHGRIVRLVEEHREDSLAMVNRLFFLDNLRVACMMMVIAHHAAQPYGPTGGWWPIQEAVRTDLLRPFFEVNRSFGMSLFFMIAGYFTVMSCDKSGASAFLRGRLVRLGIPLFVFILVIMLLQVFVFGAKDGNLGPAWPVDVVHMWFVEHLLVYSTAFALWRVIRPRRADAVQTLANPPGYGTVLAFAVGVAILSGIVRIWSPIDHWDYLLGFIRVAFADVPRDLSLFIVGMVAYRQQWVARFPTRAGLIWLGVGLGMAGFRYVYDLWLADMVHIGEPTIGAIYALWESVLCCGMCIGLTVLFRERANAQNALSRWLAQGQYAAYIIHVFVVFAVQALLVGLAAPPLAKFALATTAGIPVTFLIAGLIRKPLRL